MVKMTSSNAMHWLAEIKPIPRPNTTAAGRTHCTGQSTAPRGWVEPLRVIYDHQLVLFKAADFVVEINGKRYECQADSFIIVPPGQSHVSWNADQRAGRRFWSHFDWEPAHDRGERPIMTYRPGRVRRALVQPTPAYVPKRIFHGPNPSLAKTSDLATRLLARQNSPNPHERLLGRALLLEILLELLDVGPRESEARDPARDIASQVRSILEQIGNEDRSDRRIRDALTRTGYSYEYLLRAFRKAYGLTPLHFVTALRMERARLLLHDSDQSISKIAARVGIYDAAYFAELFRRHVGMLPSDYLKAIQD